MLGRLDGVEVAFLARHGTRHTLLPSEINYRANLFAMKTVGVERILSVSAVGSMQEKIAPGHIVVPDQFYDLTKGRKSTFFGGGMVAHVSMADPVCPELADAVAVAGEAVGGTVHRGGTYLCMEGPQFSTRAESEIHRGFGVAVIGMTNATEAKLAREAEICYVTIAMATDYDCWHVGEAAVTAEAVLAILRKNVSLSKRVIRTAIEKIAKERRCACKEALRHAVVTPADAVPDSLKAALAPITGKYLS